MKRAATTPTKSRARKKAAAPESALPVEPAAAPGPPAAPTGVRNVGSLEGALSVGLGVLCVIAAVLPRSLKQLLLLSLGGGLLYRGMTGHCGVYRAMGIDTADEPEP